MTPTSIPGGDSHFEDKADVVYGSCFAKGSHYENAYFQNIVANKVLTGLSNLFTGLHITDMETCYKAFRREVIQSVTIEEERFGFEPEITAKVARKKCRITEVPISLLPPQDRRGQENRPA